MKNLPFRVTQSPLIKYANFIDGSHINLSRLLKPYADGRCYFVHETTKSIFCSSQFCTNYEQAITKFDLMVKNGMLESEVKEINTIENKYW